MKIVDRSLRQIRAAFGGAEIVEHLAQRDGGGDHLKGLLRAFVIAGMKAGEAEQEAGLMRMNVAQADFFEPHDGLAIIFALIMNPAELIASVGEMRIEPRG